MKRTKKADAVLDIVAHKLQAPVENPKEFDNFGKHVAEQLRQVSKPQAIFLTKIINDAIFGAQCGTLTQHSRILANTRGVPVTEATYVAPHAPIETVARNTLPGELSRMHNRQPVTAYCPETENPEATYHQWQRPLDGTLADYYSNVAP